MRQTSDAWKRRSSTSFAFFVGRAPPSLSLGPPGLQRVGSLKSATVGATPSWPTPYLRILVELEGVRVADDRVRCAPLMGYVESTEWSEELDEYALGTPARAPLPDVEQQFGNLWRLMEPDNAQRRRLNNKHSPQSPMYEAFECLVSERSRVVGVKGVLTILKGRWAGELSSGKVVRGMEEVYLGGKKAT